MRLPRLARNLARRLAIAHGGAARGDEDVANVDLGAALALLAIALVA